MFKTQAGMFYGVNWSHEAQPSGIRPDKTRAANFLNVFKNILGKARVNRQLYFCERWKLTYEKNIRH